MMNAAKAFGLVLKKLRNEKGLSQEKLALNTDLDRTFISMLERGKRQPSLESILKLANSLNIPAHELIKEASVLLEKGIK